MDDARIIDAFKRMQVPLMIVAPDGAIVHCNHATHRLFGYEDEALMAMSVSDVLSVCSVRELNALIEPPAVDAIIKNLTGRKRDGGSIPVAVHMTAWTDPERGLHHALVLRDVTEEMEAAKFAKDALARANSAITGARIGVFEYNPLEDTVIVSEVWRDLLELAPSDTVDVQLEWRSRVHPADLEAALEPIRVCLENIDERASCEYRLRSKDGLQWRWMQTDASVSQRDKDGKVTRVIGATTDVTERKNTEAALRRSVAQFKSAFENAPIGKAIVSLDGRWLSVNPALCDLLGYSEDDLLRTDFQSLTHPEDLDHNLFKLDLLKAGRISTYQTEKRYLRANGAIMWGALSVGAVRDTEGCPDHFISQIVDVTEQKRLDELRNEFVATVSHELRTPLTSVLGALSLLSVNGEEFSDAAQRLLHIAQASGKRLHALVDDILDFEKFSTGSMRFALSQKNIAEMVEEAIMVNDPYAEKYGVVFKFDCLDRSLKGFVDPKRFQQVMANLLSNAAKFADAGGCINIGIDAQDDLVRISVTNGGEGIPEDFRDFVFEPFAQAAPAETRARGGTGLGLSITKQIVEHTGGTIGFESREGGETTFWFTVPVDEPG